MQQASGWFIAFLDDDDDVSDDYDHVCRIQQSLQTKFHKAARDVPESFRTNHI